MQAETHSNHPLSNLRSFSFTFRTCEIKLLPDLQLTMVGGKVCDATSKEINDILTYLSKSVDSRDYQIGLSSLHSSTLFSEFFIQLCCRYDFNEWRERSAEETALLSQKQTIEQRKLRERSGLIVKKLRRRKNGVSNDRSTSRFLLFGHSRGNNSLTQCTS